MYIRGNNKCVNFCRVNFFAYIWQERSMGLCRLVAGNGASGVGGRCWRARDLFHVWHCSVSTHVCGGQLPWPLPAFFDDL